MGIEITHQTAFNNIYRRFGLVATDRTAGTLRSPVMDLEDLARTFTTDPDNVSDRAYNKAREFVDTYLGKTFEVKATGPKGNVWQYRIVELQECPKKSPCYQLEKVD